MKQATNCVKKFLKVVKAIVSNTYKGSSVEFLKVRLQPFEGVFTHIDQHPANPHFRASGVKDKKRLIAIGITKAGITEKK